MQSWRKVGGINRSAKNENIRAPRTVVTGDYYITKDNNISGVQFADTTRQISAADTDNKGYWYDLSDDNVNIYRVDGSVNVGKKEPTFPAPYSDNQIFDPSLDTTPLTAFGKQKYDGSSPYQISYDGNMLVVGDYESQKIYTYIWNVDTFIWSKTITANEETNEINSINNPIQTKDDTYNNMHFGSNISFIKSSDANGQNSILVVSYPDQYLYTYVFILTKDAGLQWMPIKIKGESNFYNYVFANIDDSDELPNWGASISIVGSGNQYFLTVGCPNTSDGGTNSNDNCGYIIYELNTSFTDLSYTIINSDITKRSDHSQLGYSVSSFYQVDQSDSNQYTFRCAVGAPHYTKVDSSNSSSNTYCGCVNVSTINRFKSGSTYLKNGPTKIVVEPENPQNNANFGWSVSIDQTTGNYLAVGSPGVTSSNITSSNDSSNGFSSISKRSLLNNLKSRDSQDTITIMKGYYTSENVDGFETQLFVDNSIDILTAINDTSPDFSLNQFYLERENDYNNNVKIYVENNNNNNNKLYLTVTSDNLGDDAQELLLQNLTPDKNSATIFTVLDYNAFKIAANYRGYPDNFPVSKNQYWITTQIDNKLAVLAVNFKAADLGNKKRGVNYTTFDILTNSTTYNGLNRYNEAQSFYIDTGVFNSSSDASFGTVSLLTYNSSDGEYKENGMSKTGSGNLGYSVKSADKTVFVGYKQSTQINIYKYGIAGQSDINLLQSIHNDNGQFSKYIVSDNSGLVLGSNYQHLNNDDTQYNRVILYNNRKPYNFYVTGESGVTGKFVVNNEAEINSLRVTSDMSNQDIDVRYGGNLLPFSVGALGNLTSNKLLMGVGLTDEGALENGYKINSIIEKNDSAIVYTDAWGKFNKNETSGLAICPGNYFNTAAGMRLDASGNVVVNGNLTVTGDLIVDGTETNDNGGGNTPSGGGNTPSGGSNNFDPTGVITILNGNVGIGTTTPSEKLEVDDNIKLNGDIYGPGGDNAEIFIYPNATDTSASSLSWLELRKERCAFGGPKFQFYTNSTTTSYGDLSMTIDASGNVGMGKLSQVTINSIDSGPQDKDISGNNLSPNTYSTNNLQIYPSYLRDNGNNKVGYAAQTIGVNIKNPNDNNGHIYQLAASGGITGASAINFCADAESGGSNSAQFSIWTSPQSANNTISTIPLKQRVSVCGNGNVGINTPTPSGILHVTQATDSVNCYFETDNKVEPYANGYGNGQNVNFIFKNPTYEMAGISAIDTSGAYNGNYQASLVFRTTNGAQYSSPGVLSPNWMKQQMVIKYNGDITHSGTLAQDSDKRIKENITDLNNSLQKITSLRGVNYNLIDDDKKQLKAGVIAQEVDGIIPEAVDKSDENKLAVSYISFIPYLIESVKELKRENDELKEEIKKIKNAIKM